jgi:hypothetical protein
MPSPAPRSAIVKASASKQDVLFRPGMGLHAAICARADVFVVETIGATYCTHASEAAALGVDGPLLEHVRAAVEEHALAKLTDGGTLIYEARERDIACASGSKDVGLGKDLFDCVRDVVFEGVRQRYWRNFLRSEYYLKFLQFKTMESRPSSVNEFSLFR